MKKISKKVIYLPIETTSRELDSKLYLTVHALNRGYDVVIGRKPIVKKILEFIGGGFFLSKDYVKYKISDFDVNSSKTLFSILDEEGLVRYDDEEIFEYLPKKIINFHDLIFVWGEKQLNIFNKRYNFQNVILSGNPRFDILSDIFLNNSKIKEVKENSNYILVATNLGYFNRSKFYSESIEEQEKKIHSKVDGLSSNKNKKTYTDFDKEKYYTQLFISTITHVSEIFPELNFIIRPHPSEDINFWKRVFKNFENIKVIQKGNIHNWIYGSLMVIHTGSTSGIEAYYLNKPVVCFKPTSNYNLPWLPVYLSDKISNKEELENKVKQMLTGNYQSHSLNKDSTLAAYINNYKGLNSAKTILDTYSLFLSKTATTIKNSDIKSLKFEKLKYYLGYIISRYSPAKTKNILKLQGFYRKYPHLKNKDIIRKLNFYSDVLNLKVKFHIKVVGPDTFYIHQIRG